LYKIPKRGLAGLEIDSVNNDQTDYDVTSGQYGQKPQTMKASEHRTENTFFESNPSPKRSYDPVANI